jgi:hypothetical protein
MKPNQFQADRGNMFSSAVNAIEKLKAVDT